MQDVHLASTSGPAKAPQSSFDRLQLRVTQAHWHWKVWSQLFRGDSADSLKDAERFELMNSWAPSFFAMVKSLLLEDVILRLCRLIDAAEGGPRKARRQNLSFRAELTRAKVRLSDEKCAHAERRIDELATLAAPFAQWRNWRIAHEDHAIATGEQSLPPVVFSEIDRALHLTIEIMNILDPDSDRREYGYAHLVARGDGNSVLNALRMASELDQSRRLQRVATA